MFRKRFVVKIVLQLHAITCPGVWLCRHGYLEVTIKTVGYLLRTSAMEPRFPLLPHDEFTIEGYFKSVGNMRELERVLAAEKIEITLWQNGRRLAYFVGKLSDVMRTDMLPKLHCKHNFNIQLLMRATPAFPGILVPKIELSASVALCDRFGGIKNRCNSSSSASSAIRSIDYCGEFISPNFQSQSRTKQPKNRHMNCCEFSGVPPRRQLPVCHTRHCSSESSSTSSGKSSTPTCPFQGDSFNHKNTQRRLSESSGQTFVLSRCSSSAMSEHGRENAWTSEYNLHSKIDDDHQDYCDICIKYRRAFMGAKV